MDTNDLYESVLDLKVPWSVYEVRPIYGSPKRTLSSVEVTIVHSEDYRCPECGVSCSRHDSRTRRWRHLDTCNAHTILIAEVPRVRCKKHGVRQVAIPWSDGHAPYSIDFECYAIDLLLETTVSGVARLLDMSWDAVRGIQERAVIRGLQRRAPLSPRHIGVDETSAKKHHRYVTIVSDQTTGLVLHVTEGKSSKSLENFYDSLSTKQLNAIESVSMDMSSAFISATQKSLAQSDTAICFDHFHVTAMFTGAVGTIRAREHKELMRDNIDILKGTRFDWLCNDQEIDGRSRRWFHKLTVSALHTARAWAIKEAATKCWQFCSAGWALRAWKKLLKWIDRCRIPEIKKLSSTIKTHLWGILNAITHGVTNSPAEGINSRVQKTRAQACGFRSTKSFINSIYFRLGGLDLYPGVR